MTANRKMDVIIAGYGLTPVGEHWEISLRSLAGQAIHSAIQNSGGLKPQALFAANILAGNNSRQAHIATLLADHSGLTGIEAVAVEAGGASGGMALRQGIYAVASGMVEVALVVGVEKFTDLAGLHQDSALTTLLDADYEAIHGLTPDAQAALLTHRYMYENHVPADGLAGFSMIAHANGVANKYAMFRKAITLETYLGAEKVIDPLNIFDLAPAGDGAAALVITRSDLLERNRSLPAVRIAASIASSDTFNLSDRKQPLWFSAAQDSVQKAFTQAGINKDQVNIFEVFDACPVFAALSLEAAGYAPPGQGWKLAGEGSISLKGTLPCSTMGGLKARGNPGGATGIFQVIEAAIQLQGLAGANQVANAKYALVQSLAGPASLAVTHILECMNEIKD